MAKTAYQKAATEYAREYLDELLKIEDMLGEGLNSRIDEAVAKYMKEKSEKNDAWRGWGNMKIRRLENKKIRNK